MAGYTYLGTSSAREKYMTEHATRWSELARLPYFHMVRMIVIDPMHNLLLGKLINPHPPQSLITPHSRTCEIALLQHLGAG